MTITTSKTPTLDERITQRRNALTKRRTERQDELDLPRTLTTRQVNAYLADTMKIDQEIITFNTAVAAWLALPSIEPDTKWRDFATTTRATLSARLLAIKSPIRDKATEELAARLTWSIKLIDHGFGISTIGPIVDLSSTPFGGLMREAGYAVDGPELRGPNGWRGTIKEVEARIKDLTKQHADARAALDLALQSDEDRVAQEAEAAALNEAFNNMHCKYIDGHYVAHTNDGEVIPPSELTPVQRRAVDRADGVEQEYRQSVIERQAGR